MLVNISQTENTFIPSLTTGFTRSNSLFNKKVANSQIASNLLLYEVDGLPVP